MIKLIDILKEIKINNPDSPWINHYLKIRDSASYYSLLNRLKIKSGEDTFVSCSVYYNGTARNIKDYLENSPPYKFPFFIGINKNNHYHIVQIKPKKL